MRLLAKHYFEPRIFSWSNIDDIFGRLRPNEDEVYEEHAFSPVADIIETDTDYRLSLDLPGLKKEDIKIEVLDNSVVISGERLNEKKEDSGRFQRFEKSYGSFKRSFVLPKFIQADGIQAHHDQGVLDIMIPKIEPAKAKKIEVKSKEG